MIVDDDDATHRHLTSLLAYAGGTQLVAHAKSADEAVALVQQHRPDVIFLDIKMPGMTGMEFIRSYGASAAIVLVTGYPEYGSEAWDTDAADFLLKPVDERKLLRALERARSSLAAKRGANLGGHDSIIEGRDAFGPPRICVARKHTLQFFAVGAIVRFYIKDGLTTFRANGTEHTVDLPLDTLAQRLQAHGFTKTHRAELVNTKSVVAVSRNNGSGGIARLADGDTATVSRRYYGELMDSLNLIRAHRCIE